MDIPIRIGHLYTKDFVEDTLFNFSSACMVKEMGWAGLYTGGVLPLWIVLTHLSNQLSKFRTA